VDVSALSHRSHREVHQDGVIVFYPNESKFILITNNFKHRNGESSHRCRCSRLLQEGNTEFYTILGYPTSSTTRSWAWIKFV
jgi:hypothetical protein